MGLNNVKSRKINFTIANFILITLKAKKNFSIRVIFFYQNMIVLFLIFSKLHNFQLFEITNKPKWLRSCQSRSDQIADRHDGQLTHWFIGTMVVGTMGTVFV